MQTEILGSSAPDEKRLTVLKYLIHLVGDVHQPLHAGYKEDRGGNNYLLQAFRRGSNLHALWDSGLIRNLGGDVKTIYLRLSKKSIKITTFNPVTASEESCEIVGAPGYYPERLGRDYIDKFTPIMELRLMTTGSRLADLFHRAMN